MPPVIAALAWSSVPALVFGVALHAGAIGRTVRHVLEAARPAEPVPAAVPIERLAADLRRLARLLRECDAPGSGVPMAQRLAAHRAYEDRLVEACGALEVRQRLRAASGWEHAWELALAESALIDAGLAFDPPTSLRRPDP